MGVRKFLSSSLAAPLLSSLGRQLLLFMNQIPCWCSDRLKKKHHPNGHGYAWLRFSHPSHTLMFIPPPKGSPLSDPSGLGCQKGTRTRDVNVFDIQHLPYSMANSTTCPTKAAHNEHPGIGPMDGRRRQNGPPRPPLTPRPSPRRPH